VKDRAYFFLSQGISPHQLALAVSVGLCLGIIPILGVTSVLCAAIALRLRLNMALVQAVNYLVYPLQLLFFIPFFKAGALFSGREFQHSLAEIQQMMSQNFWDTVVLFFEANIYALAVWILVSPLVMGLVYFTVIFFFNHFSKDRETTA
jgi:uncharacterized protein (DUF2062 family)